MKVATRSGAINRSLSPLRTRSSSSWRPISSAFVQVPFEPMRRAAVAVAADDRIAAATQAADQQTAQKKMATVCAVEGIATRITADLEAQHVLPGLDPVPEHIIDDTRLGVSACEPS